jgi:hypothetical protein
MLNKLLILSGIFSAQLVFGGIIGVTDPSQLSLSDEVDWSQLGGDQTIVGTTFNATSLFSTNSVSGTLAGDDSIVSVVCPAGSCSWASGTGFGGGDSLIWTSTLDDSTNTGGNGPLGLSLANPVYGAGLLIDSDGSSPGTFTAEVDVYGVSNNLLGTFSTTSTGTDGNAVFLGALDTNPEIAKLVYSLSACSLQNCNNTSFAADSLLLDNGTPEPSTVFLILGGFGLVLFVVRRRRAATNVALAAAAVVAVGGIAGGAAYAQTLPTFNLGGQTLKTLDGQDAAQHLTKFTVTSATSHAKEEAHIVAPSLPLWNYTLTSSIDNNVYSVTIVGASPFNKGARSTKVPAVLIPVVLDFNYGAGKDVLFDPTAGDTGCIGAGNTAMSLTEASPLFANYPFSFGGTNVGNTQYADALFRGEFWTPVSASGGAYHLLLGPITVAAPQTVTFSSSFTPGSNAAAVGFGGQCGSTPFAIGSTNPGGGLGLVNVNNMDAALQTIMTNLGITANEFPFFVMYNVAMTDGPVTNDGTNIANCCILGYHSANGVSNSAPGQTYGIADFEGRNQTLFGGTSDVSAMSHEVNEWMNDPGGLNPTPPWGNIGQVSGCQNNFEVGDPLSGTLFNPNPVGGGFTYHLQELAFFSWFYGGPSIGANGWYSDNNTFTAPAILCPPGGTN